MNVMDFKKDVNILLKNKHFKNHCYAWEYLSNSFEHVAGLIDKKIRIYKPLGLSLLVLIPILSAVISALVGIPPESLSKRLPISGQELLFCLSLILTILTILNSLFKTKPTVQSSVSAWHRNRSLRHRLHRRVGNDARTHI